ASWSSDSAPPATAAGRGHRSGRRSVGHRPSRVSAPRLSPGRTGANPGRLPAAASPVRARGVPPSGEQGVGLVVHRVSPPAAEVGAGRLRDDWRVASLRAGWRVPRDWWVPAVEAVLVALAGDGDLVDACARLGRARAYAGVGL